VKEGRRETKAAFDKEVSERQPGKDFLFEVSVNGYMHCFILLCFCQCAAFLLPLPSNHVCKCKCQIFYLPQPSSLPPSPSFPQPIITPPSFSSLSQNQNVSCQINQSTNQQQQQQQQQQQHYHHYQTGVTVAALPGDALKLSSSSFPPFLKIRMFPVKSINQPINSSSSSSSSSSIIIIIKQVQPWQLCPEMPSNYPPHPQAPPP